MRNAVKEKETRKRKIAAMRKYIREIKKGACEACGMYFPHYIMEFDHVRGKKKFNITGGCRSWKSLYAELKKCDLLCANCHRRRTWRRRQQSGS